MLYSTSKAFGFRVGCITASGIMTFGAVAVSMNPLVVIGGGFLIAMAGLAYAAAGADQIVVKTPPPRLPLPQPRLPLPQRPTQPTKLPATPVTEKPRAVDPFPSWKNKPR